MNTNNLVSLVCQGAFYISLLGLILYLPLKPHWSQIFSFGNAMLFYCGIGGPALGLWFIFGYGGLAQYFSEAPVMTALFIIPTLFIL